MRSREALYAMFDKASVCVTLRFKAPPPRLRLSPPRCFAAMHICVRAIRAALRRRMLRDVVRRGMRAGAMLLPVVI